VARLIACLSLLALATAAHAAEHVVAPGTLATALARARPGDTLRLAPGVHPGPLTIDVPIRLVGAPGAVIDGGGNGTVLTLAADGIEVSALTIRGAGNDLSRDDSVVLLRDVRGVTVERCHVQAQAFGIYLRGGSRHRILRNVVRGNPALPSQRRGNGIHLWHTEQNEVRGNRLINARDGIYLSFAHDNVIRGNTGAGLRYGIHYMYSERNTLDGNRFRTCTGGFALMFSMSNRIADNVAIDNRDFGILCQQLERSLLVHNHSARNGRGLFVENSAGNRFAGNRVEDNGVGVFLTAGSEGNVFTGNDFDGNLVQAFQDIHAPNIWSESGRGNAWSDYTGFDWNGDGVGDVPYRLQTAVSALMARRPSARWFSASPALELMSWWEARMVSADPGATDVAPLVRGRDPVPRP
jgi:nitrous oxidase accessory protein